MKNIYLLFLVVLFAFSTDVEAQKIRFGVSAGLNTSTFSEVGNLYNNEALKTGFGGGLNIQYKLSESFGIQSGIMYEQKGFRRKVDMHSGEERLTGIYNYVIIPLTVEGSFAIKANTRFYANTGLYTGFKTYDENAVSVSDEGSSITEMHSDINHTDAGWIMGCGIEVPMGNHFLQIGIKYSLGLTEVMDASDDRNKSLWTGITLFF